MGVSIMEALGRRISVAQALGNDGGHGQGGGLARTMGLLDLCAIGVGGTLGSGIFSIAGLVAKTSAGPAVVLSFLCGGLGCSLSAAAYMELAGRVPATGSVFTYAYVALGRGFAACAAWLLTLEYGLSAAAVAANWGQKMVTYLKSFGWSWAAVDFFSPFGGLSMLLCTGLMLLGVSFGKRLTNSCSTFSVCLIMLLCGMAATRFEPENWQPFVPPQFGAQGIAQGALTTFFSFVGFDEVCCLSGEAKNPTRNVPIAVLVTVSAVTLLSMLASGMLAGCQHYSVIDANSGFEIAFRNLGWPAWSQFVSIAELLVLFVVVYVSLLAQPRIFFALAQDGLLPPIFARRDRSGELSWSVGISGILMALVAAFIDFSILADSISAGVLLAFSLANASVLMLRYEDDRKPAGYSLGLYTVATLVSAFFWQAWRSAPGGWSGVGLAYLVAAVLLSLVALAGFVGLCLLPQKDPRLAYPDLFFAVPLVPFLPCLAIAFNLFMVSMLSARGLALLLPYLALGLLVNALTAVWLPRCGGSLETLEEARRIA